MDDVSRGWRPSLATFRIGGQNHNAINVPRTVASWIQTELDHVHCIPNQRPVPLCVLKSEQRATLIEILRKINRLASTD